MYILIFLMIIFADQGSKIWALSELNKPMYLTDWFNLTLTYNKGISFSFLTSDSVYMPFVLSAVALLIIVFMYLWFLKEKNFLIRVGLTFVMAGALSNVIDRLYLGFVVDFIDWHIKDWHWPAFNLADSFICTGIFLMMIQFIFEKKGDKK